MSVEERLARIEERLDYIYTELGSVKSELRAIKELVLNDPDASIMQRVIKLEERVKAVERGRSLEIKLITATLSAIVAQILILLKLVIK